MFPLFIVDAFTNVPFCGNPAAVCLVTDSKDVSETDMQNIATEMNLSETAFVTPLEGESFSLGDQFSLRWFTPTTEVPLCGHATMASAAVLFHCLGNKSKRIRFNTASGTLEVSHTGDKGIGMVLPRNHPEHVKERNFSSIVKAVVGTLPVKEICLSQATKKLLIRLTDTCSREDLEGLHPDPTELLSLHDGSAYKGVMVTLKADPCHGGVDSVGEAYDFISRYFAPWNGITEDPVTGSAHTVLSSYWAQQLRKSKLYARQCSPRGGDLVITMQSDTEVHISGQATVVVQGQLNFQCQ